MYDLLGKEEENSIGSFTHNIIPPTQVHARAHRHTHSTSDSFIEKTWVGGM